MPYRIAGIDVHKKMLAVVGADVEVDGDFDFERQKFGTTPTELRRLADWLVEHEIEEVVMESTAQYWRPVWETLEQHWRPRRRARDGAPRLAGTLHLAQAQSNRGRGGRKQDFPDAERLVKRLVAQELTLSFVPDAEQRLWRTVMRRKYQVTRNRVQLQNRLEALLEEAHIKVSSLVSDLLGISARRMLQALADGETDQAALATLAAPRLRATPDQLCDAFQAGRTLHPVYRRLLKLTLEELRMIEDHSTLKSLLTLGVDPMELAPLFTVRLPTFFIAARDGDVEAVRAFVDAGANPSTNGMRGWTVLMLAASARRPSTAMLQCLLDHGADVNAIDDGNRTALDWALTRGETAVSAFLRKAGALSNTAPATHTPTPARPSPVRDAVELAGARLQPAGPATTTPTCCVSCHNHSVTGMAVATRARGVRLDVAVACGTSS